ncbi:DNA adenine methylase [Hymenobacter sp. BT664]|uniref:site-specific DNA-methyltransferase (adenine-specific) n=1 Tax=Hymenobacter montanus TaxID=2771359 RepID=A0A927BED9_9BACT|nr:DNA adenine methylase [Hymenobacter montanus]MBD2768448.1 DNA adenine methylase [Hymenobacter montanus]
MIKIPGLNTYFGGKGGSGTYQRIINHIRPHDTLVIPFAGNCAVTRAIKWPGRVLINDLDTAVGDAWRAANLGPRLEVYNLPALDFIRNAIQSPRVGRLVIYCDPPYPLDSRKSSKLIYNHEMTHEQHVELLDAIRWLCVDCLVSTYPNDLYAQQLSHWHRTEFQSMTRKGPATEWLFYNYPTPTVLHDDCFSGENYRTREYTKRKAARWVARYKAMPPHEQQRILGQILENTPPVLLKQLMAN